MAETVTPEIEKKIDELIGGNPSSELPPSWEDAVEEMRRERGLREPFSCGE